jgi:hypothetical protein
LNFNSATDLMTKLCTLESTRLSGSLEVTAPDFVTWMI